MACSSLLGVEYFRGFSMPHMWVVLVGAEGVTVYSSTGLSVRVTNGDSAGVTDQRLRIRAQSYGWRSIGFFAPSSLQHLFGRGHHTTYLILNLNGLTFY
jgi:hypothetical protein